MPEDSRRSVYARKALEQVPRLLGNLDRNPHSPTYGCFHRDYWLDKTSDFPDAVRQFAVQALALVYARDFPDNPYRGQPKIRDWAVAALDFWARIQHADGSFDEFYPFERGWVGPTAFTTFTSVEAYRLLEGDVPADVAGRVRAAIRRSAVFIGRGDAEEDHLANHHAMACLAVWKAYQLLGEPALRTLFERLWRGFLTYHDPDEGWSREYDGTDPGYLSATVSFLAKVYQDNHDPAIRRVLEQAAAFCAYFAYPDGSYAGTLGSRNTLHFYPHGFEVLAPELPVAAAVAEHMLRSLDAGRLVPPAVMSDRYLAYRVGEYLQAYLDWRPRPSPLPLLPSEAEPFTRFFPKARIFAAARPEHYVIANLAKGGVVKVFDRREGRLLINDAGIIGRLADGRVVSSQWISPAYQVRATDDGWEVSGYLHVVTSQKVFTLVTNLVFRGVLLALGWSPPLAHWLKARIRKTLILKQRTAPIRFRRRLGFEGGAPVLENEVAIVGDARVAALNFGDEFSIRHVPQSRYFQPHELASRSFPLDAAALDALNAGRAVHIEARAAEDSEGERKVWWTP